MRINTVAAARKEQGTCQSCGKPIEVGQSYRWIKFRYAGTRKRHSTCPSFRPSDMTNAKYGQVYAAMESAEDALDGLSEFDSLDEVQEILNDCAEQAREVGEEYEESASNMESAFPNGAPKIDEIRESAEACEDFATTLEDALGSSEDWNEDDARREVEEEELSLREIYRIFSDGVPVNDEEYETIGEAELTIVTIVAQTGDDPTQFKIEVDKSEHLDEDEVENAVEEKRQEWRDNIIDEARTALGEFTL